MENNNKDLNFSVSDFDLNGFFDTAFNNPKFFEIFCKTSPVLNGSELMKRLVLKAAEDEKNLTSEK